jgi:hypothetical protein
MTGGEGLAAGEGLEAGDVTVGETVGGPGEVDGVEVPQDATTSATTTSIADLARISVPPGRLGMTSISCAVSFTRVAAYTSCLSR